MKKIMIFAITMIFLIGCETAELDQNTTEVESVDEVVAEIAEEVTVETVVESVTIGIENLNVRKGASLSTEIMEQVHKGATYEIIDQFIDENDEVWYQIEVDDDLGWVVMRYTYPSHLSVNDIVKLYDSPFEDRELYAVLEKPDFSKNVIRIISIEDNKPVVWYVNYYQETYYYYPVELKDLENIECVGYVNFVVDQVYIRVEAGNPNRYITLESYDVDKQLITFKVGNDNVFTPHTINMETGETTYSIEQNDNQSFVRRIKVIPDILNLREHSLMESKKLGQLYKDSVYDVLTTITYGGNTWYKIQAGNRTGWILGEHCEETSLDVVEYLNAPLVRLYDTYNEGDSLLQSHFEFDGKIIGFTTNGNFFEAYHFNNPGTFVIDIITEDTLGRNKTYRTEIVVKKYYINDEPIKAYTSMDKSSKVLFDIFLEDTDLIWTSHFDYVDGKTSIWYQATKEGQEFYINEPGLILPCSKVILYLSDGSTKTYKDVYLYPEIHHLKYGYYAINQYFKSESKVINDVQTRIISQITGEDRLIKSDFTDFTNPNSNFLFERFSVDQYKDQPFTSIEVIDLQEGHVDTVFTLDESYQGYELTRFVRPSEVRYIGYTFSDNDWDYADTSPMETQGRIYYESDKWNYTILSDDAKQTSPLTGFDLYEDTTADNKIGHYDVSKAKVIDFIRLFDIQDRILVMWFEVEMENGIKGYTYRARHDYEYDYIYTLEPFHLMTENGPVVINESTVYHKKKFIPSAFVVSNHYYISDYDTISNYESIPYEVINYDGSRSKQEFSDGFRLSPNGKFIVNNKGSYSVPIIEILANEDSGLNQTTEINLGHVNIGSFEWINDKEVNFKITIPSPNFAVQYDARIYMSNGAWIFESDYQTP